MFLTTITTWITIFLSGLAIGWLMGDKGWSFRKALFQWLSNKFGIDRYILKKGYDWFLHKIGIR